MTEPLREGATYCVPCWANTVMRLQGQQGGKKLAKGRCLACRNVGPVIRVIYSQPAENPVDDPPTPKIRTVRVH